ncbi:serine/threonine-protein kinase Sgk2 [Cordyceps javanica]|uniref:Serine/threonine-protein kinase Sgk2 n=1 Tax=Cordyceps javanica TaxID=43265 RepID=A0A545UKX5_9HYPO|nr:serine/threonine-protein kinase Sgk2 [Cordyceps javanica]TQW01610.1 serine/threonine-protein kinase Sgk2 [Cordyceps javanica]
MGRKHPNQEPTVYYDDHDEMRQNPISANDHTEPPRILPLAVRVTTSTYASALAFNLASFIMCSEIGHASGFKHGRGKRLCRKFVGALSVQNDAIALMTSLQSVGHREITSIAALRAGLGFSSSTWHAFRATTHGRSSGYNSLQGSESSGSSRKRRFSDNDPRPPTTRRSHSRRSTLRQAYDKSSNANNEASDEEKPSVYTPNREGPYENRILSCIVISSAGYVISDFM